MNLKEARSSFLDCQNWPNKVPANAGIGHGSCWRTLCARSRRGSSLKLGKSMRSVLWIVMALAVVASASAKEGVVLLHGLARTSRSMDRMERAFADVGYEVVNVDYQSREMPIAQLAAQVIGDALQHRALEGCSRVHFVAHSLGGILVRSYFATRADPRLGRVVMLGPPNQGSEVVDRLGSWRVFRWINGPAGSELGTSAGSVPISLGAVPFELGVVAGDRSINWINSMMIAGPDDGKVSVERTKVMGMKEQIVVHVSHPFMMRDRTVIEAALRFVRAGSFDSRKP